MNIFSDAQAKAPLNYFLHSAGPAADPTRTLGWVFTAITVGVCLLIAILLLIAIFRKRPKAAFQEIGREEGGIRWIIIGTAISTCVLFFMGIYALITLNQTAISHEPGLKITVTGYDWWWKVDYGNADPALRFTTANEIHIPVGVPVLVTLKSADVIHAFWVPQLAGKTEMIPGLINQQWLQADKPGIYHGKCTQFCGAQHAHMDFEVIAESKEDFQEWENAQRKPAAPLTSVTRPGQLIFMNRCSACHSVQGTETRGEHAPNLTHLMSRRLIAAGMLANNPANVMNWIQHAQEIKSGAQMPDMALTPAEESALSAYLTTLK